MTLETLLKYDDNPVCINSFYKSFNIWFYVRYKIFDAIISSENNVTPPTTKQKKTLRDIIPFLFFSIRYRIPKTKKKVIFFSTNVVNMKNGNSYENRLYDYYFNQIKQDAIIVEDPYNLVYRRPRNVKVYYSGYILIMYKFLFFFTKKNKKTYIELSNIVDTIKTLFPNTFDNFFWDSLKNQVYKEFNYFLFKKKFYIRLLRKIQPLIVFREDGSYGQYQDLALACHENKIIFAEFQHGNISSQHIAYNYGQAFFDNEELKRLVPSYYLTFGSYWGNQIRHPAYKIPIGFPYLQNKTKMQSDKNAILIISDGDSPNQNKELISFVRDYAIKNELEIILKLHPCEKSVMNEWYCDLLNEGEILIKLFEPVYDYIPSSKFVIGGDSTVMYETLCFGITPFVYRTRKVMSKAEVTDIFNTFGTKDELLKLMNGEKECKHINYELFFDKDFRINFINFINKFVK